MMMMMVMMMMMMMMMMMKNNPNHISVDPTPSCKLLTKYEVIRILEDW